MSAEISKAQDVVAANMVTNRGSAERVGAGGVFTVTCLDANGQEKWSDSFHNLVVNVGLQDMNAKYFTSVGFTAAWYLGLVDGASAPTYAAADTLASHAGWTENTAYVGTRKAVTFGSPTLADPSVINNSGSAAVFTMSTNGTVIAGAFLANAASGTSGILFSVGSFTGGNKSVDAGDTLNVTYQFSLDAA
jgi:hypothetical protein